MGVLYYGSGFTGNEVDDWMLAHLKVVITSKLRRNESFTLAWADATGRSTIWLHPAVPLRFVFDEPRAPDLDRKQLEELAAEAGMRGGIVIDSRGPVPEG